MPKFIKQFLFCLLILLSQKSIAQINNVFQGKIIDAETGEVLDAALIRDQDSISNGALSDENGLFTISSSKSLVNIEITHTAYERKQVQLTKTFQTIKMNPLPGYLNQYVVSGNKSEKRLHELTVSMEIIQPELIQKKNVIKVENVLQQVSSISVTDKQVNIRNSSGWSYGAGSRVMILQDGMPMLSGDAGQPQWTFINTDNIENVEVLKGASSLLYGSSALGGIVHIKTAKPSDSSLTRIQAFTGIYSNGERNGLNWSDKPLYQKGIRFLDSRKIKKLDLVTSIQYLNDDGYRMGDYEERVAASVLSRYHLSDSMYIGLNSQVMSNKSASFLLWESYDSAYSALDGAFTENKGFRLMLDPKLVRYHKQGKQLLQTRFFRIKNDIENGDPENDQSNSSNLLYAEYQWHQKFRKLGLKSITGIVFQNTVSNSPLFQGEHSSANQAAFIQLEKKHGALLVNAGARYERYQLDDYVEAKPIFRTGINYSFSKYSFLRASYGQGYRFPTIAESFIRTKVGALAIYPNEELQSESGNNLEIGIKQGWKVGKSKGFIDVAVFQMRYDNMMEFSFAQWSKDISIENGLGLGFKSVNVGPTQIRGIEFSGMGSTPIGKGKLSYFGGYTYSIPQSLEPENIFITDSTGRELSFNNTSYDSSNSLLKYRYQHLIRLDVQYDIGNWQFGVSTRYNSFMDNIDQAFVTFPISFFILGVEESRTKNTSGDLLFDFRCSYSFGKLELGVNILNVLNREVVSRPADMGAPRYSNISLKYEF